MDDKQLVRIADALERQNDLTQQWIEWNQKIRDEDAPLRAANLEFVKRQNVQMMVRDVGLYDLVMQLQMLADKNK